MLYFHSCPHCKTGTVHVDWDAQGSYFECLNCGWMLDLAPRDGIAAAAAEPAAVATEQVVARVA